MREVYRETTRKRCDKIDHTTPTEPWRLLLTSTTSLEVLEYLTETEKRVQNGIRSDNPHQ